MLGGKKLRDTQHRRWRRRRRRRRRRRYLNDSKNTSSTPLSQKQQPTTVVKEFKCGINYLCTMYNPRASRKNSRSWREKLASLEIGILKHCCTSHLPLVAKIIQYSNYLYYIAIQLWIAPKVQTESGHFYRTKRPKSSL